MGTRLSNDKKEEQEVLDHIKYKIVTKAGLLGRGTYPSINDSIENPSGWLKPVMLARLIQRVHVMKQGFCAIGCGTAFPTSGPCIRCEENGRKDIEEKAERVVRAVESVKKAGNKQALSMSSTEHTCHGVHFSGGNNPMIASPVLFLCSFEP